MTTIASSHSQVPSGLQPIRFFSDLSSADVAYAGGKGANLGQLTRAGLPVPPGFVIGAPAYAAFRDQSGLRERLNELLSDLDVEDTTALRGAAELARQAVSEAEMPPWLADAIAAAYAQLAGEDPMARVAVRSSATAEDTASASFAGMNESFLNIRGRDGVIDAVRRCWASLFGARTIYYRGKRGFEQGEMEIAVVVERQIQSTRSGVMFTIDPASGDTARLVIEGAFGLGEAVVSGQVSPDRYVVDKARRAITVRSVRPKELIIEPTEDSGTRTRPLSEEESHRPVLTDDEVMALADLGVRIEDHYGSPQDTEWAIDADGAIWMLQSRPVTTLAEGAATAGAKPEAAAVVVRGLGAAPGMASGVARLLRSMDDAAKLGAGDVLVT
ncbi:MAG TPA: PEP/pyruvate-binding domain-containing protein, partial [Solirubrobacteraceae bacterium]|nr:PEP/pyruvate-binding domain-containing protein [Solirubrobacteraceae bacterium]